MKYTLIVDLRPNDDLLFMVTTSTYATRGGFKYEMVDDRRLVFLSLKSFFAFVRWCILVSHLDNYEFSISCTYTGYCLVNVYL